MRTNTGWPNGGSSPHQPRSLVSSSHGPEPPLNILRPMIPAATPSVTSAMTSESTFASPPSRPCCSRQAIAPNAHSCICIPPTPSGSFIEGSGPATKPSRDIERLAKSVLMAS